MPNYVKKNRVIKIVESGYLFITLCAMDDILIFVLFKAECSEDKKMKKIRKE